MTADQKIELLVQHRCSVVSIQQEMLEVAENANKEAEKMEAFIEAIDNTLNILRSDLLPL